MSRVKLAKFCLTVHFEEKIVVVSDLVQVVERVIVELAHLAVGSEPGTFNRQRHNEDYFQASDGILPWKARTVGAL